MMRADEVRQASIYRLISGIPHQDFCFVTSVTSVTFVTLPSLLPQRLRNKFHPIVLRRDAVPFAGGRFGQDIAFRIGNAG